MLTEKQSEQLDNFNKLRSLIKKYYLEELKELDNLNLIERLIEISDEENLNKDQERIFHNELEENGVKIPIGTGC